MWIIVFDDIPSHHVSRFLLDFTGEFLGNSLDEKLLEKSGRPICSKKTLLNILIYAEFNRVSSTEELADLVNYHHFFFILLHLIWCLQLEYCVDLKMSTDIYLN